MTAIVPSILMIAAIALLIGGIALRKQGDRRRATLMLIAAAVFVGNVLILTLP